MIQKYLNNNNNLISTETHGHDFRGAGDRSDHVSEKTG